MRPKTALHKLGNLLKAPSFTSTEAVSKGVQPSLLAHYIKSGDIERLARGIYRASSPSTNEDFLWEDLVAAVLAAKDGVICLTSALAVYELTEEFPRQHWIAIRNSTRYRAAPSIKVIRMRNLGLGKTQIKLSGIVVPIFDRERTIVDSFRYLSKETALKALKTAISKPRQKKEERINFEKMREYAKILRVNIEPYLLTITT